MEDPTQSIQQILKAIDDRHHTNLEQLIDIKEALAINTTETRGIREQLIKLNGSVSDQAKEIGLLEQFRAGIEAQLRDQLKRHLDVLEDHEARLRRHDWFLGVGFGLVLAAQFVLNYYFR